MIRITRRQALSGISASLGCGIAGCMGGDSTPRYQLSASPVPGTLAERFRWGALGEFTDTDRQLIEELVQNGSLTTAGFVIADLDRPQYVEHDGDYYAVSVQRGGDVTREKWVLWFDLIAGEPPTDAESFTSSLGRGGGTDLGTTYSLSEEDVRAIEDATGEIVREFDLHDPEDEPLGRRGHVFVRRTADETDLLPKPPFTHVRFDLNDGRRYARAVTDRGAVELRQYEYTASRIAGSRDEYQEAVRDRHLQTVFDRSDLSEGQREIVNRITSGATQYEETAPLSEAMQSVLDRLGLRDVETPEPKRVSFSEPAWFQYQGGFYEAELQIFR